MPVWTKGRIAKMISLRDQGLSFTEVAKRMGGVTRNAVIGKYQRVTRRAKGLPDYHKDVVKKKSKTKKHRRETVKHLPRPKPPPEKNFTPPEPKMEAPIPITPDPAPVAATLDKQEHVSAIPKLYDKVDQLTSMECKYPIGQISDPGFTFCFVPVSQYGRSYCDFHHKLCYTPAPTRKRTNYRPAARVWRP